MESSHLWENYSIWIFYTNCYLNNLVWEYLDVKTTSMNGNLEKTLYVWQPMMDLLKIKESRSLAECMT